MNVLHEKRKLNDRIHDIVKKLKFKNSKINLAGSASLQSQRYFSDYDFNSVVKISYKPSTIYKEFKNILVNQELYFVEFKIEYLDGTKQKIFDLSKLKKNMFKNINFVKIDYVLWFDYHFKELSIVYIFNGSKYGIDEVKKDYEELIQEGNNYKALKRLFGLYKITNNKKEAVKLTKFFNSSFGKLYEVNSNLKTLLMMPNEDTRKEINLKFLKLSLDINLEKEIEKNDITLNNEAKKYLI